MEEQNRTPIHEGVEEPIGEGHRSQNADATASRSPGAEDRAPAESAADMDAYVELGYLDGPDEQELMEEESVVVMRRPWFIAACAVAAVLIAVLIAGNVYQWRKGSPAVATVNGKTITRSQYDQEIARTDGGQTLDNMISRTLVEQDAAHRHVTVSPDEIDAQLKQAKVQFPTDADYRHALDSEHITELQLRDSIRLNLMLQKLAVSKVVVSDADIQQEYDQNKDTVYNGKTLDQVKDSIKQQLTQQKQQDATSAYLANLRSSAHITKHL